MLCGTPMGEPASCAQANSVCMDAEQRFMTERERVAGDSARVATVGFVDDIFPKYAYDREGRIWPRREAEELLAATRSMYPAPLSLE